MKLPSVNGKLFAATLAGLLLAGCEANGGAQGGGGGIIPRAAVVTFVAAPATVLPGGTSTLSWTTTDATSCTASDAWTGDKPVNGSEVIMPPTTPGSYTYVLSCTGPGGANAPSSVTVTVGTDGAATINSFTATPATVNPGGSSTLAWNTTGATSCTASGNWSGDKPVSGSEVVTPPGVPGSYLYTLTCEGEGGTNTPSTISVTVAGPGTVIGGDDISDWTCTERGAGTATGEVTGLLCTVLGLLSPCSVDNPQNAADQNELTFAEMNYPVSALDPAQLLLALGLSGSATLKVVLNSEVPAGRVAAFDVELPGGTVELDLLQDARVISFNNGVQVEEVSIDPGVGLDLLDLLGGRGRILVGFRNTLPYDALDLQFGATLASADVLGRTANVYDACVNAVPPTP
jgi:hypothetical protein